MTRAHSYHRSHGNAFLDKLAEWLPKGYYPSQGDSLDELPWDERTRERFVSQIIPPDNSIEKQASTQTPTVEDLEKIARKTTMKERMRMKRYRQKNKAKLKRKRKRRKRKQETGAKKKKRRIQKGEGYIEQDKPMVAGSDSDQIDGSASQPGAGSGTEYDFDPEQRFSETELKHLFSKEHT